MVAAKCVQNLQSVYRLFNLYIVKELSRTIEEKFIDIVGEIPVVLTTGGIALTCKL